MQVEEATNKLKEVARGSVQFWEAPDLDTEDIYDLMTNYDSEFKAELKNLIQAIQEEQQSVTEMG